MIIIQALTVAILFGSGAYLMLRRDLVRVIAGVVLISHAATLLIISAGLSRGVAPIHPLSPEVTVSDPLVQAMALTAIVITLGISAFLLSLLYRTYRGYDSIDERALEEEGERAVADRKEPRELG